MKKAILVTACTVTFFFEGYAQQKLLSYDTLRYNHVIENYCLEKDQNVLDSAQSDYIKKYSIWAKKNFKRKHKNYFIVELQSNIDISDSERLAKYELIKREFLKYGLAERYFKLVDLSDPTKHYSMRLSGCPNGVKVHVEPYIKKREYCDLFFCDH